MDTLNKVTIFFEGDDGEVKKSTYTVDSIETFEMEMHELHDIWDFSREEVIHRIEMEGN